jgi:hypothetical protein
MKSNRLLVGAIKLNREKILLVAQVLHGSLELMMWYDINYELWKRCNLPLF